MARAGKMHSIRFLDWFFENQYPCQGVQYLLRYTNSESASLFNFSRVTQIFYDFLTPQSGSADRHDADRAICFQYGHFYPAQVG